MNTEIIFNIEVENNGKTYENEFILKFQNGECIEGEAYNPTSGYGPYTAWTAGWTEQDEDENYLISLIKEYSQTMELEQIVAEMEITDINKPVNTTYECYDGNSYNFKVTCLSIEMEE